MNKESDKAQLVRRVQNYINIQEEWTDAKIRFLRNLTTISVGFLALLITLKPSEIEEPSAKFAFLISLSLLVLGIISSAIAQYYEVFYQKEKMKAQKKNIQKFSEDPKSQSTQLTLLPSGKVFYIFEVVGYFLLGISMVGLMVYLFISELS